MFGGHSEVLQGDFNCLFLHSELTRARELEHACCTVGVWTGVWSKEAVLSPVCVERFECLNALNA